MTRRAIADRIRSFLEREFPRPAGVLEDSTDLLEDWFVDSLGVVMTVLFLEREFGLSMKRSEVSADNFRDLQTLSAYVAGKLAEP